MTETSPPPRYLVNQKQACALLGISRRTLSKRVKNGHLHSYVDPHDRRRTLYDRREIDAITLNPSPRTARTTR